MRCSNLALAALLSLSSAHASFLPSLLHHRNSGVHSGVSRRSIPHPAKRHSARGASTTSNGTNYVASTWYAGWHATDFPIEYISWEKYTSVTYAFAVTTADEAMVSLEGPDATLLPQFVTMAHQNNVSAGLSIGGWGGSLYFSNAVATATNRTAFVKAVTNLVSNYSLDAIDFDWEYPGHQGIGCNAISPNDTSNFLAFLQELRPALPPKFTLSAAVATTPFANSTGLPSADVSAFSKVLDYVAIMNYDVWGPFSPTVGPNAPLNDTCAPPAAQAGSAVSAVKAWTAAGFPASQIVLGVASYGHSYKVPSSAALSPSASGGAQTLVDNAQFDNKTVPAGDAWDAAGPDVCGVNQTFSGDVDFWGMISGGYLGEDGKALSGIQYKFDTCSQTPFVYNATSEIMVAYDDATSFAAKGQFIQSTGLRGFAMWEAGGDYDDILLDSIRTSLGMPTPPSSGSCDETNINIGVGVGVGVSA